MSGLHKNQINRQDFNGKRKLESLGKNTLKNQEKDMIKEI